VSGHDELPSRDAGPLLPPWLPPAEVRLQLAQEAGRVGLWEWDARTGVTTWDAVCASIFGIALADFEGRSRASGAERTPMT
jgi:PAS domain-containing protein